MVIKHKRRPGLQPSQMEHETRRNLGFVDGVFPLRCRAGMILTTKNPRKQSFATGTGTGITIFRTVRSAGITNIRNKKPQISGTPTGTGAQLPTRCGPGQDPTGD
tara:strand:- start:118 stop:432 length:315 start_codon:yes stop_codon:yes gene_type:complete